MQKSAFSAHLFHISGCKFLVDVFIRFPVTYDCAAQPMITGLLRDYEEHKRSNEYKKAVEQSERRRERQLKRSADLWWAEHELHKGKHLSFQVRSSAVNFFDLSEREQSLAFGYEEGSLGARVKKLHQEREAEQAAPKYAGAGACICSRLAACAEQPAS